MTTMSWDNTLAYLAELNTRQCAMNHDSCRSTDKYIYSGQNLCTTVSEGRLSNGICCQI